MVITNYLSTNLRIKSSFLYFWWFNILKWIWLYLYIKIFNNNLSILDKSLDIFKNVHKLRCLLIKFYIDVLRFQYNTITLSFNFVMVENITLISFKFSMIRLEKSNTIFIYSLVLTFFCYWYMTVLILR